ncbi:MAG: hypothetical protein RIR26_1260 [Pseudomonadota bacterium]
MNLYSVREIFELRHSVPVKPRYLAARLFKVGESFGLVDGSGAIWPVCLKATHTAELGLETGSVFRLQLLQPNEERNAGDSGPENETIVCQLLEKLSGSLEGAWLLPGIPDPRLPFISGVSEFRNTWTQFFRTPTTKRLQFLSLRSLLIQRVRHFFLERGFIELDTPVLVASGGVERYLSCFETEYCDHRGKNWTLQLPTSPEMALKKIVVEGAERVFSLAHAFRNSGELSKYHDPEFMMLEWYRRSDDFYSLQNETQRLVEMVSSLIPESRVLPQGKWDSYSVEFLFKEILDIDLSCVADTEEFRKVAAIKSLSITKTDSWDDIFCKLFMEFVEPFLQQKAACFVTHYPRRMGALAAVSQNSSDSVDRFELYLFGVEICNGYRELIDFNEFLVRFESVHLERPDVARDALFESASSIGMYPCVGNALGVDRLISVLMSANEIQSILPWPFSSRFPADTIALE